MSDCGWTYLPMTLGSGLRAAVCAVLYVRATANASTMVTSHLNCTLSSPACVQSRGACRQGTPAFGSSRQPRQPRLEPTR
eukprot:7320397-Pyramimonas_sp.AAC.1